MRSFHGIQKIFGTIDMKKANTELENHQSIELIDLPDEVLSSMFYTLNNERGKEKEIALTIIKILSQRNKLSLLTNRNPQTR